MKTICFQDKGIVSVDHVHANGAKIFKKKIVGDKEDNNFSFRINVYMVAGILLWTKSRSSSMKKIDKFA